MFRNKVIGSGVPKSDYDMEEDEEQEPNFYGELEAGPYRGNAEDSDGWMETRKIRESAARGELIRYVNCLARRLPDYINSNDYTGNV